MSGLQHMKSPPSRPIDSDGAIPEWTASVTGGPPPEDAFVPAHEVVARLAADHPAAVAVRCGDIALTYGELISWSRQLSHRLAAAGVGAGDRVALLAEPSAAMIASVLGVLGAGAAYVPVDLAQPDARVATILHDAQVAAVVTTAHTRHRAPGSRLPVVTVSSVPVEEPDAAASGSFAAAVGPADPAYLIYTSGSTGEPKGVIVEHRNLAASTRARLMVYSGNPTFLLMSPLAFDSSVAGIWGTLQAGGCLVVASADELRDADRLVSLVSRHRVTRTLCVPTLYGLLLDAAERAGTAPLASLRQVIVAGEALPQPLVDRHFAVHSSAAHSSVVDLVNEYGPTETTVWATFHRFTGVEPVSIGGPVPGARLYVLDDELQPVPPGAEGELFIGGTGVTRGYFGRPEATAAVFLDDPFTAGPGARMYRTGDLVRRNADHRLDFIGRKDDQVKVRGHRVEPGAVESALRLLEGVQEAVVLPDAQGTGLIGFVASREGADPVALRRALAEQLPPAMVPGELRVLPELPRNLNGKLDRALLRTLATEPPAARPPAAPLSDDPLTAQVAAAWSDVLGVATVPLDVNFFDFGGNSLAMFKLQDALERHCGLRPSVVSLFQETTVTAQATLIRTSREHGEDTTPASSAEAARKARTARLRQQRARKGTRP